MLLYILLTPVLLYYTFRRLKLPLPPGLPRLPLIGNIHQYPKSEAWKTYQKWHKKYGPIITLKYGPHTVIVLGNYQVAKDLLDKRSDKYSSRPRLAVVERATKGLQTVVMPFGNQWRIHRRLQNSLLNDGACQFYREIQDIESHQLLYDMLSTNDFSGRFGRFSASLTFALAYGKRMPIGDEHEVREIDYLIKKMLPAGVLGTWLLCKWKQIGDEFHNREVKLLIQNLKSALKRGTWNWAKSLMGLEEARQLSVEETSYVIGSLYEAASDTTPAVLEVFVLASLLHPDGVQKAQLELDTVIGQHGLPSFEDISNLPYTMAFVKAVLRWRQIVAGGVPHMVNQDDEYMGYHIPKGSIVIANHWWLDLDDAVFENANSFSPERWIHNPNLPLSAFGFGRRVCVGKYLALNSLNIVIARFLWAYDIVPDNSRNGIKSVDSLRMQQIGLLSMPFSAVFRVRSPGQELLIQTIGPTSQDATDKIMNRIQASVRGDKRA